MRIMQMILSLLILWASLVSAQEASHMAGKELTLQRAVSLALQHNPVLRSLGAAEKQAGAEAAQLGRAPNPELGLEIENFAGSGDASGFASAEYTLFLSQTFELGDKRARQQDVAGWEAEKIRWEAELNSQEIAARATKAFIAILLAQTELALTEELAGLARQDLEFVERLVSKGGASPVELNRTRVAVSMADLAVKTAFRTLLAARIQLSSLWDSKVPTFGAVTGELAAVGRIPSWEELSKNLDQSPQLKQWDLEASQRQAEVALASALGKIDLTASAGIRHYSDSGDNAVVASIAIPLPVHNKNQDGLRAAQIGRDRLDHERQVQYLSLLGELSRHYEQLANAQGQISAFRDEILPLAETSMTEMTKAYRKGKFKLTDVLAVRRTWFEVRGTYAASLARYHETVVEINLLLGNDELASLITKENN